MTPAPPSTASASPDAHPAYCAAWIPASASDRPWDPTPVAVGWLLERAEQLALKPVLLCGRPMAGTLPPALRSLRRRAAAEARRSAAGRAVLAYLPTVATAARAFRAAQGGAVAVVEAADLPLGGWAAEAKAVNLLAGRTHPALPRGRAAALERLLRRVEEPRGPDQEQPADAVLPIDGARATTDDLVGYLLAHGRGPRDIRQALALTRVPGLRAEGDGPARRS